MAKRAKPKEVEQKRKDWCKDCIYNTGENEQFHYMWGCFFLDIYSAFNLGYCKAERLGKGKFKEKS